MKYALPIVLIIGLAGYVAPKTQATITLILIWKTTRFGA